MSSPADSSVQNLLPVQAYFDTNGNFQTFIGQGKPFYATINPLQSGLNITNSTINSTTIGAVSPSTGVFTNISTTTGTISTTPSNSLDIANKQYVDNVAQGLNFKQACLYTTTGNITLSGLGTQANGDWPSSLSAGDRILVKNQATAADNGIYVAASSGWTRSTDMDTWAEVPSAYCFIQQGTVYLDTSWVCTSDPGGTLGVTAINFVQFGSSGSYTAGTGLGLAGNQFYILDTTVTAGSYGASSKTLSLGVNAQGQLTSVSATDIAIAASQVTSGTFDSARLSGSYTGITGVGTIATGTWQASTISVSYGGTGATTLTGYVKGSGTSALTASPTVPTTDLSGTITNAQLANSTISGVSLGSNLANLTFSTGITATSSTYNGGTAVTISNASPMTYPSAGIANSTGTAWGTSYSTTGTGTVVALATAATLNNPTISNYIDWTGSGLPSYVNGREWYDSAFACLSYYNDTTNNVVRVGQQLQQQVRNSTGSTITKGQVVYISGSTGQIGNIILAQANSYTTSQIIGVANQDIANNTNGYIITQGIVEDVNTNGFTSGAQVYLSASTPGALTQTEPSTPNYAVHMGVCLYANNVHGKLWINPINKSIDTGYIIGQVAIAQGGTNGTATPTAGAIAYGSGTAYAFTGVGTTGQVLTSNGSSTPTWTTPASAITISDDTTTNATRYPLFANQTTGSASTEYVSSTKLQFNPSTGVFTATSFTGAGTGLTGTASSLSIGGNAATATSATSATTATNLAGGANGSLPYQTGSGATTFLAAGTNGYVLTLTGGVPTWAAAASSGITITDDTTTNATRYLTFTSATTGSITGENVASTKLQFNPSTGVLASPGFSASGNLTFTGTGNRVTGDFSNATVNNRAAFATSTTNGSTGIYALPNGTSTASSWQAANNSDPTNASKILIATNGSTDVQLVSGINGTGTYLPMTFWNNGAEQMRLTTAGNFGIGTNNPGYKLDVNGVVNGTITRASNGIHVNSLTISANYTIASGDSGMSAGPVTINSGVTVTVSSGSKWVVL